MVDTNGFEYDDKTPENLSTQMGLVNPKKPLIGLEHIAVLDRDIDILSQTNGPVVDLSWSDVKDVIDTMQLYRFQRQPHDLRNYLRWKYITEREYSSVDTKTGEKISGVLMYILKVRLKGRWGTSLPLSRTSGNRKLFEDVNQDVCILSNDFPYALQDGITHVVVWLRTPVPVEPIEAAELKYKPQTENGISNGNRPKTIPQKLLAKTRLTDKSIKLIEQYVKETFMDGLELPPERVLWFKNWTALQSIPALEHFHVMLCEPPMEKLEKLYETGGKQININI